MIQDLEAIILKSTDLNSTVRFILHPPGFSFPNENNPGRQAPGYGFNNDFGVSLVGLRNTLKKDLGEYLIDVEDSMTEKLLEVNNSCEATCEKNYFFFGHDGHFDANAHLFLCNVLCKKL